MNAKDILSILAAASLLMGCKDDYLDVDYYSILPGDYMFESEKTVNAGLTGCYDTFYPDKQNTQNVGDLFMWNWNPTIFFANNYTLDIYNGSDDGNVFDIWNPGHVNLRSLWGGYYTGINRCNFLLDGLAGMDASLFKEGESGKSLIEAQARMIRAIDYYGLVRNFGRVPLLVEGDTYNTCADKPRCDSEEEVWNLIVSDCRRAAEVLDWTPEANQYGRVTKGTALAYQAKAEMYLKNYEEAKKLYKQIIDSGVYELLPCYSYLFDVDRAWTKEDIWAIQMWTDNGNNKGGIDGWNAKEDHYMYACYNTAGQEYCGWGSLHISYECYYSFEDGDRRRKASMVALGETNPFTGQTIGAGGQNTKKIGSGYKPNIYSIKYWREALDYWTVINSAFTLRHFRYAEAILDYAECCFRTGDDATGWEYVGMIRDRAWGNREIALSDPDYPIPMLVEQVTVPDAKTYYSDYRARKDYTADVWMVALTMERRHEFNSEYSLYYDMVRCGILPEFLEKEYPKNVGVPNSDPSARDDWHLYRDFDYIPRTLFPIPQYEIDNNEAISESDQNPGY